MKNKVVVLRGDFTLVCVLDLYVLGILTGGTNLAPHRPGPGGKSWLGRGRDLLSCLSGPLIFPLYLCPTTVYEDRVEN